MVNLPGSGNLTRAKNTIVLHADGHPDRHTGLFNDGYRADGSGGY